MRNWSSKILQKKKKIKVKRWGIFIRIRINFQLPAKNTVAKISLADVRAKVGSKNFSSFSIDIHRVEKQSSVKKKIYGKLLRNFYGT